jgi:hypothetical protein
MSAGARFALVVAKCVSPGRLAQAMSGRTPLNAMKPMLYFGAVVGVGLVTLTFASYVAGARAGTSAPSAREPPGRVDRSAWSRELANRLAADITALKGLSRVARVDPPVMLTADWRRKAEASRGKLLLAAADLGSMIASSGHVEPRLETLRFAVDELAAGFGQALVDGGSEPAAGADALRRAIDTFDARMDAGPHGPPLEAKE